MTKAELMYYVGKTVLIYFKDDKKPIFGKLGYIEKFSEKYGCCKPDYFYINNINFKVSHVRKLVLLENCDIKSELENAYLNGYNCGYSQAVSDFQE